MFLLPSVRQPACQSRRHYVFLPDSSCHCHRIHLFTVGRLLLDLLRILFLPSFSLFLVQRQQSRLVPSPFHTCFVFRPVALNAPRELHIYVCDQRAFGHVFLCVRSCKILICVCVYIRFIIKAICAENGPFI